MLLVRGRGDLLKDTDVHFFNSKVRESRMNHFFVVCKLLLNLTNKMWVHKICNPLSYQKLMVPKAGVHPFLMSTISY